MANQKTTQNQSDQLSQPPRSKGVLGWIEDMGNKLPHPFWIFIWICILVIVFSGIAAFSE